VRSSPGQSSADLPTGYVFDERYLLHVIEDGHPESPERLRAINRRLSGLGLIDKLVPLPPIEEVLEQVGTVHTKAHISSVRSIPVSGEVALIAVGGVLAAIQAVHEGIVQNAFCAVRPPGHHAHDTGAEEGFCYFNNIAIAARYAQKLGHHKILIVDWDYHHGNGTQDAFYGDPSVLFFSTHDLYTYPGTGLPLGKIAGFQPGTPIDIPLTAGASDDDIIRVWETYLMPAVDEFKPDFVLLSAGFDGRKGDLLGTFSITDEGFCRLTEMAMEIADTHCGRRLVSTLEGGYAVEGLADAVASHITALMRRS
jgi:acetoin utilization deacetylase AcuC-like enzyme